MDDQAPGLDRGRAWPRQDRTRSLWSER
jgi:hypothetical protein